MSNEINELNRAIGRLEAKVDSLKAQQEEVEGLKTRVTDLEKQHSFLKGALAVCMFLWGALLALLRYIPGLNG